MTKIIDQLLIPKGSKIKFMNKTFITNEDIIVDGSVKKLATTKTFYYHEIDMDYY